MLYGSNLSYSMQGIREEKRQAGGKLEHWYDITEGY